MTQQLTLPEEHRIATINDQISELENQNSVLENEIETEEEAIREAMKRIRAMRRKIASNDKRADKAREKRRLYAVTAAQLRLADMP